jgi:2-C-methyl-D-erythritol 2,4-cyclodiphosphate synthase
MRIGIGYDLHRLVKGRRLVIGGVEIPHEKGLLGHSDADVLVHAVIDAILGAAHLGDIGRHFPDTDPHYQDADSIELLRIACTKALEAGFSVNNVDAVIIAERPKLADYIPRMEERIALALDADPGRVGVKAKTAEGTGPEGSGEAIAAWAVVTLAEDRR